MMSFLRKLSLHYALRTFKGTTCAFYPILGTKNNPNKILLTQSRDLFINKSKRGKKAEAEIKKQHDLFQLSHIPKHLNENSYKLKEIPPVEICSNVSDLMKKIQNSQLNQQSTRNLLLDMLKLYKQLRFSSAFQTDMDILRNSEEFEKFAQAVEKFLPGASVNYLILAFQVMNYYQIPYSSILMQKLHALILDNINQFELPGVIKMYLTLKNKDEAVLNPLKDALLSYMKYRTNDSINFTGDIRSLIYFSSLNEVPFSVREKILKKIISMEFQLTDMEPVMLVWLSYSLCSEQFQFLDKTHFLDALKNTISSFTCKDLITVLRNIIKGIYKKVINYDKHIFDQIAICSTKYDLQAANIIMKNLLRVGHVNYELAHAIAEKLTKSDTDSLTLVDIENLIQIFGNINYKNYLKELNSDSWWEIENILKDHIKPETNFKDLETLLNLFMLELNTKDAVNKALDNFAKVLECSENVSELKLKRARLLYHCHCAVYSSPPENVPKQILPTASLLPSVGWKEAAYEVFNGEEYVLEKCKTPFGVLISFITIIGPDCKPISLASFKKSQSKDSNSIEDFIDIENIPRPPGSKVFAFIEYLKESVKFRNVPLLRLEPRLITFIHKSLGYKIFHLYLNQKIVNSDGFMEVLSSMTMRELNYFASKTSESSAAADITNVV